MSEVDEVLDSRDGEWKDSWKEISQVSKTVVDLELTPNKFIAMMILLKLIRFKNSEFSNRDCLIDIIGYAKLALRDTDFRQ